MEELILLVFYESNNVFQERARVDDDVGLEEKLQIRDTQEIEKIEAKKKKKIFTSTSSTSSRAKSRTTKGLEVCYNLSFLPQLNLKFFMKLKMMNIG